MNIKKKLLYLRSLRCFLMKIAFLISAHTDPVHLQRLVKSLPQGSEFFIHVDAKSDQQAFSSLLDRSDVHFIRERYGVMWGSMQQVRFQRALVEAALAFPVHFDYLFTLSGLDYPVWSNTRILHFLQDHFGDQFIQGICLSSQPPQLVKLYREYRLLNDHSWRYGSLKSKFRVALRKLIYALGFRKPLNPPVGSGSCPLYKGSDWWAITSELADYALRFMDSHPEFVRYFQNSFSPSETIWQTIVFQSPFASRCILSEGEFTRLEDYTPLTYIEYGQSIKELTEADFERIVSSNKMFCRKTTTDKSDKLMEMIDEFRSHG